MPISSDDALRRRVGQFVLGTSAESDPRTLNSPHADGLLVEKIEYGEGIADEVKTLLFDPQTAGGLLISLAADDAELPADPEFRAALVGYLEWGTHSVYMARLSRCHPRQWCARRPDPAGHAGQWHMVTWVA